MSSREYFYLLSRFFHAGFFVLSWNGYYNNFGVWKTRKYAVKFFMEMVVSRGCLENGKIQLGVGNEVITLQTEHTFCFEFDSMHECPHK